MPKAVALLSGGIDSATATALARRERWTVHALTVRYGQVHAAEIDAARRVASALGVERHVVIDVDLRTFGGSALVGEGEIPKDRDVTRVRPPVPGVTPSPKEIPPTYVPARNTVLLSLGLAWAEALGADRIVIGVNALDYSGYPDCRPEFISAFEYLASLATRAGLEGRAIRVWAPLQHLTKAAIVRLARELELDTSLTFSCYDPTPEGRPCGRCDSCQLRARGFAEAGLEDIGH